MKHCGDNHNIERRNYLLIFSPIPLRSPVQWGTCIENAWFPSYTEVGNNAALILQKTEMIRGHVEWRRGNTEVFS